MKEDSERGRRGDDADGKRWAGKEARGSPGAKDRDTRNRTRTLDGNFNSPRAHQNTRTDTAMGNNSSKNKNRSHSWQKITRSTWTRNEIKGRFMFCCELLS